MSSGATTVRIPAGYATKPRPGRWAMFREGVRLRRQERARRAQALRTNGARAPYVPGSEHTHILPRGRGF
jgi:hypothetical protein